MPANDDPLPFESHVELLRNLIAQRSRIADGIQALLNARHKPLHLQQDRLTLQRLFEDCFFSQTLVAPEQAALRGQLQQAHWADGFRPRDMPGIPNEMFDPAEMMTRAFAVWRHTRWPGGNGRLHFGQTLFNLYLVRCLALLVMRVCDAGGANAADRLEMLQQTLDTLWNSSPPGQPVLVRDVRWLVPVAQSPTTDALAPYFEAARRFEECLPEADRLEIHKASVLMAGGHLRSQLRHFTMNGQPLADHGLLLSTRASNALDCAMTVQHLVPLLAAYQQAERAGDAGRRRELAGIICQGISADPELYVNRLDLLGPYSMIETLFVTVDGEGMALTEMGIRHAGLVDRYRQLLDPLAAALHADCLAFRPVAGSYSPYGVMFGFSSNILEHMAMKTLQPDAETRFSLEDVFADSGEGASRLAWVSGWRRLPHVPDEVLKLYEYPQQFAVEIFERIEQALCRRAGIAQHSRTGRLLLDGAAASRGAQPAGGHFLSSDPQMVETGGARACDSARLLADRQEGVHLVSFRTAGGWTALSKDVLTDVLGMGVDLSITGIPAEAAQRLRLLYPALAAERGNTR